MPTYPPYTCTGFETPGNFNIFDADGVLLTTLYGSACFADWYCTGNGWTWSWRDGDPDTPPEEP
jgi:hypothetical protein